MAAKKKAVASIKIQVGAQTASASSVGTALGPHGVNIQQFCQDFNSQSSQHEKGLTLPVEITIYADRTLSFIIKSPPASVLIKKALGLPKGSQNPSKEWVGEISVEQMVEIAKVKANDMNALSIKQAVKSIAGTARSMGIRTDMNAINAMSEENEG